MTASEHRAALDLLVREVQQALMAHWPPAGGDRREGMPASPRLVAALAVAEPANDTGLDVEAALADLQAAWGAASAPREVEEIATALRDESPSPSAAEPLLEPLPDEDD
jgi:hypothetical protein